MVIRSILFLLLSGIAQLTLAVTFESSVDRTQVSEGESIVLTLRYNSNVFSGDPDLSPLKRQFEIINQNRKNSFQLINGRSESWTIWTVAIIPKQKGTLLIPAISFDGERTRPIQVSVSKVSQALKNQQKDVFFHTETDIKTAYVQGQILYTEKLYFSVPLENGQLSEVMVDEALVQPLGETKHYRSQVKGQSFEVYERQSLIFPQTSGEMVIPGPIFNGEISNGRWRGGRPIRISHGPITLQVLPKPASYPSGTWLPAKALKLDFNWLGNPQKMKVGEPITLEIALQAEGLTSAQLPDIELAAINGLKYYPDQAQASDHPNHQGITGLRKQSIAIVPTKAGSLTFPEIKLAWWNTKLGRLEHAIIPAQRLTAYSTNKQSEPSTLDTEEILSEAIHMDESTSDSVQAQPQAESSMLWPIISGVFALLWLATLFFLFQMKRTPKTTVVDDFVKPTADLKSIKQACRKNQPTEARQAILVWAQAQWDLPFASMQQVAEQITDKSLRTALQELDYTLYSQQGNSAWQGEYLWQLFKSYKSAPTDLRSELSPLFPTEKIANG